MELNHGRRAPLGFITLFSLITLFISTDAICVPRNISSSSHAPEPPHSPSPSPSPSSSSSSASVQKKSPPLTRISSPSPTPTTEPPPTPTPAPTPSPAPTTKPPLNPTPAPSTKPPPTPAPSPSTKPSPTPTPAPTTKTPPTPAPIPTSTTKPSLSSAPTPTIKPSLSPSPIPTTDPPSIESPERKPAVGSPSLSVSMDMPTNVFPPGSDGVNGLQGSLFARPSTTMPFAVPELKTTDPALKKLCETTDYPAICVSSLTPLYTGSGNAADPATVLAAAIKAATQHAHMGISMASSLASSGGASPGTVSGLGDCKESYNNALDNLKAAMEALSSHDVATANSMLSAVVTDSENCEDAFEESSPMTNFNDKLRQMASNCLAISSLIN